MWMNTEIVALNTSAQTWYSPWFPKGADNGVFTVEVVQSTLTGNDPEFEIGVYTKNLEDEGSAPTSVGTLAPVGSSTFYEVSGTSLKQLVRLAITFQAGAVGEGIVLRVLAPTWYDTAV
jgi:hypothetical protein